MGKRIVLIIGGQRSGKSAYAEKMALGLSPNPVYMATAQLLDDEMKDRVAKHRARRGTQWENIEEPIYLSRHNVKNKIVLIDCLTLWASNCFFADGEDISKSLELMKKEFDAFTATDAVFVFVTNEVGFGGIGASVVQRKFADLQGFINQYVAERADEVVLMVAGIPVKIKG